MRNRSVFSKILAAVFSVILLLPVAGMLIYSFFARWPADAVWPERFTLKGFTAFFTRDVGNALLSALFSMGVALATLIVGIPAAKGLSELKIKGKAALEVLLILPMLLPAVTVSLGSHKLFLTLRFTGGAAVFVMHLYFALPYAFKLLYSAYRVLGRGYTNTAKNLGASEIRIFVKVELPVFLPAFTAAFIMAFVVSYSQYFVNLYIGGAKSVNYSVILSQLLSGSDRNLASVYSLMYLVLGGVVVATSLLVQRAFSSGRRKDGRT